jgi:hypothetical protein
VGVRKVHQFRCVPLALSDEPCNLYVEKDGSPGCRASNQPRYCTFEQLIDSVRNCTLRTFVPLRRARAKAILCRNDDQNR